MPVSLFNMAGQLHKILFRDTINVERISATTVDERGIESQSWQSHLSNVMCKIDALGTSESKGNRNTILENYTIYFPDSPDIKANDRLQSTSDSSLYYEIDAVRLSKNRSGNTIGVTISAHIFE